MTSVPKKMQVHRSKISEIYIKEHLKEENKIDSVHPPFSSLQYLSYLQAAVFKSLVNPLLKPMEYAKFNLLPRKAILLVGVKNVGKRFFIKSVCVEHNIHLLDCFFETEKDVNDAYRKALDMEPCVVFISNQFNEDKERILYEIAIKIEKLSLRRIMTVFSCKARAFVNEDVLKITGEEIGIKIPDEDGRKKILESFNLRNFENVDLKELSRLTPGYLASELHSLCVSAASSAILCGREARMDDFLDSLKSESKTTLDDIGALAKVKQEIEMNIILPLKFPEKFKKMGITKTSGILLYGPPGCGKTMLAKAIANMLFCNFISVRGPELINKYVGDTEKEIREIFNKAKNQEPCVLFFDEIDSLCNKRTDNDFQTRIVNQMLTLLDGIDDKGNVFIVGATNRIHALDSAILRPGRFDKIIEVPIPVRSEQIDIFKKCSRNIPMESFDIGEMDMRGFTGADIAGLVREAAMIALKKDFMNDNLLITKEYFFKALKIIQERKKLFN